jgi:CDGSH-type Zn-finger protein
MPEPPGAPGKEPYVFQYLAGHKYAYCMCKQSTRFPICDGTHRTLTCGTTPMKVVPDQARSVAWCTCGTSKAKPYCDGSHKSLSTS